MKVEGYKVTKVGTFPSSAGKYISSLYTVYELERAGKKVSVVLCQGITPQAEASTKTLFDALAAKAKVGDYVNVEGMLAYSGDPVIIVNDAAQLVKLTEAPEKSDYEKAAEKVVYFGRDFLSKEITKETTISVPAGVTVALKNNVAGVTIADDNSTITFAPTETKATAELVVTATEGETSYSEQFNVQFFLPSLDDVVAAFKTSYSKAANVGFPAGTTIEIKAGTAVEVKENHVHIAPAATEETNTLTITINGASKDVTFTTKLSTLVAGTDKLTYVNGFKPDEFDFVGTSGYQNVALRAGAAQYVGNINTGSGDYPMTTDYIQLRTTGNNSGIVVTESAGKVAKVTIVWNSGTADARELEIYGSTTAYTAATDLYGDNKGTKLASLKKSEATDLVSVFTVEGDYAFIGIKSKSGALYVDSITIEWVAATPAA